MPTLIVLNPGVGEIQSVDARTGAAATLLSGAWEVPDGLVVDEVHGVLYWTNMGKPSVAQPGAALIEASVAFDAANGFVERANLDGTGRAVVLPEGSFVTGKQLVADFDAGKLYFSDREGLRVLRANLDGTGLETLVQTGDYAVAEEQRDSTRHCVGIAIDPAGGISIGRRKARAKAARAGFSEPPS